MHRYLLITKPAFQPLPRVSQFVLSMRSVELNAFLRRWRTHGTNGDLGLKIVLASDWRAGQTTQHGYLPDMGEGVGYRALKQSFGGKTQGRIRRQVSVEFPDRAKEKLSL